MTTLFLIVGIIFVLSFIPALFFMIRSYRRYRGKRVVTCPETKQTVAVEVKAARAALSGAFDDPDLQLSSCTRWPERQDCGQECVAQIEAAPDGCLVRERLAAWYKDSRCALCGRTLGEIRWTDRKPGLLTPELKTLDWSEVVSEELPTILATHKPICWNCHVAESFLRRYPDRVVKDPRKPAPREPETKTGTNPAP
ncbi:MAG TPA: hypothetical protein VLU06_08195 [Thermoanaerobaculia bacterium]|nr:hypothetical protein [Thermoanaerobaculia bacterium]